MVSKSAKQLGVSVVLACAAGLSHAATVIDDFASGAYYLATGPTGFNNPNTPADIQAGNMVGGRRLLVFETADAQGQSSISTLSAYTLSDTLLVTTGAGLSSRTTVAYGIVDTGPNGNVVAPLALDLSGTDRIRVQFDFLSNSLNFNILLYNGTTPYVQIGHNVVQSAVPFHQDFLYSEGVYPDGPIDFTHIDLITIVLQTPFAGTDFAIDSIVAVVPIPAALPLLAIGLLPLLRIRRHVGPVTQDGSPR